MKDQARLKKEVLLFLTCFLVSGVLLSFGPINVLADSGSNGGGDSGSDSSGSGSSEGGSGDVDGDSSGSGSSGSDGSGNTGDDPDNSGSSNDDKSESTEIIIDEQGREVTVTTEIEKNGDGEEEIKETRSYFDENGNEVVIESKIETGESGETETETIHKFIDENGNEVKVVVKVEMEGNEIERTEKTTITTPDGIEIILKNKVETEEGVQETKNSIEVKGFLVTTKLSVKEEIKNGATIIKSQLSTGAEQDIIVMPDEAHQIALDAIKAQGISIELTERAEEGVLTSVFMAESVKQGKLFGLFNINVDLQALINPITGELIEANKPWWAFLVAGEDTNQAPVVEEISPISDTP